MQTVTEKNKAVVQLFNKAVIEEGDPDIAADIFDAEFINHSAPPGADNGPAGMLNTFNNILRPALPDLKVIIYDQVAEGDIVTTRKAITGTHRGTLLGIPATGNTIKIDVIDMVRLRGGKYLEHWGVNTLPAVLAQLKQ